MDGARFAQLVLQSTRKMTWVVLAMAPGCRDVDDIIQDACSAMWKKIDQYDPNLPFSAWACGFARMQTLAFLKKQNNDRLRLSDENLDAIYAAAATDHAATPENEKLNALEDCLAAIPATDRNLLAFRYIDGHSVQSIANRPEVTQSPDALYKFFARLQQKLIQCIDGKLNQTPK